MLHLENAGFKNDGTAESLKTAAGDDAERMHKLCALIVLYMDSKDGAFQNKKTYVIENCLVQATTDEVYRALDKLKTYKVFIDGVARDVKKDNKTGDPENDLEYFKEWPEEVFMAITKTTPAQYFGGEAAAEPATSGKGKKGKKAKATGKRKTVEEGEAAAEPATSGKKAKATGKRKTVEEGNVPASPGRASAAVRKKKQARVRKAPTMPSKAELESLGAALEVPVRGPGSPPSKKPRMERREDDDEMQDASGDDEQPSTLARIRDLMEKATEVLDLMQSWDRAALDVAMTNCVSEFPTNEEVLEMADKYEEESELAKKNLEAMIDLEQHINTWNAALDEQLAAGKGEGDVSEQAKRKEEVEAMEKALDKCETICTESMLQMKNLVTLAELAVRVEGDDAGAGDEDGDDDADASGNENETGAGDDAGASGNENETGASGNETPTFGDTESGMQSAEPMLPDTPPLGNTEDDGERSGPPRAPLKGKNPPRCPRHIGPGRIDTWMGPTAARSLNLDLPELCLQRALRDLAVGIL